MVFDVGDLLLFEFVGFDCFVDFLAEFVGVLVFFGVGHLLELLVVFDLGADNFVLVVDDIDIAVQHIHIVLEVVVLFFRLDESRYDFLNRRNTSCFLNLIKSVLNHLHITCVHIH